MLCDECHKNEAMINLKLILDGEVIEKHLCTESVSYTHLTLPTTPYV